MQPIILTVPAEGWTHTPRDFDPDARLVTWEQTLNSIGAIEIKVYIALASFKQGYRLIAERTVTTREAIQLPCGTIPHDKHIVVETLEIGAYTLDDPHGLLRGPELTAEELHTICEAHRPQMFAVQRKDGAYFTLDGRIGAIFENGVSIFTIRYEIEARALDVVRGLANQWSPVTTKVVKVPTLTPAEERELTGIKAVWNRPTRRKRTTKKGKRQ